MGTYTYTRATDVITFWSVSGQKLGDYQMTAGVGLVQTGINYYFGGKLIKNNYGWVSSDRLGSNGTFYPYGIERPSATTNGTEKFTGYVRDAETGNDYADQRYMSPGNGRFMTPDRKIRTSRPGDPGTWNKYAYAGGDPINRVDRHGTDYEQCDENGVCQAVFQSELNEFDVLVTEVADDPGSPCYGGDVDSDSCQEVLGFLGLTPEAFQTLEQPPPQQPPPTCFDTVQLFTWSWVKFGLALGGSHSYIEITGPGQSLDAPSGSNTVYIEGNQSPPGTLTWSVQPGHGIASDSSHAASTVQDGVNQTITCAQANALEGAAANFNDVPYNPLAGWHTALGTIGGNNSNSYMHWFLSLAGWVQFYANTAAENTIGWNAFPIPGNQEGNRGCPIRVRKCPQDFLAALLECNFCSLFSADLRRSPSASPRILCRGSFNNVPQLKA
jgi:RHS repeat-associated protein